MPNAAQTTEVVACSLTDAEYKERRAYMRERLIPRIAYREHTDLKVLLGFDNQQEVRSEVETFVQLEKQCCGFLSFVVSPPGEPLTLEISGPEGSQTTLQAFADAAGGE